MSYTESDGEKMKKIATITFHWATNYGAVLQAWALQKHLKKCGHETEIINYVPRLTQTLSKISMLRSRNFAHFKKEKAIKRFRRAELKLTKKVGSQKALHKNFSGYDTVQYHIDEKLTIC